MTLISNLFIEIASPGPYGERPIEKRKKHIMRRIGRIIQVKPEAIKEYERIHAAVWPEVLATIAACNIRNYSIFRHGTLLFAYFEYIGDDLAADMAKMAEDPKTQEWWTHTDPMQEPLPDHAPGEWWTDLKEVFYTA
jgi:L-rhamnose mutarotase